MPTQNLPLGTLRVRGLLARIPATVEEHKQHIEEIVDNELFTFRVWLVRLGLNGDEFKNTRNHLLANLEGDRAWRYDKDTYEANKKKKKSREMER